ncbi:ead/Ea22-like family protein [Klebsiella oxytoca]|uniref:ead/Ea22-like family protein n=1 Tax=Klebsiella oxytoca TaxID=571 RepID=UPI00195C2496|nr:ead/Ea22-like family protein [Klebsiella oxytoca]QRS18172.1 ead/Ea22-like family protein [Klebsiella oxytoca]
MTTDITKLAQSLKAAAMEATLEKWYVDNDFDVCSENYGFVAELHGDNLVHNAQFIAVANPANIIALVEALEKAQQRIAELEESNAQIIQSRDHYKRMTEEGLKRLAKSRTVTVKLPELCVGGVQGGHAVMVPYAGGHWFNKTAILEMLTAAGIKWETE